MLGALFDPEADIGIREHFRPHWSQAGAIVFITFRTADSIPAEALTRWEQQKADWLKQNDCPSERHWSIVVPTLNLRLQREFKKHFNRCREDSLDTCRGQCVLRNQQIAKIVSASLLHFDRHRYRMGDFVVMPNHVHLLAVFESQEALVEQCDSWLHYSARQINLSTKQSGKFWQQEPFDHLVRSPEQYSYLRNYIANNGGKAGLLASEYLYRRYV
jgi:putative transposase